MAYWLLHIFAHTDKYHVIRRHRVAMMVICASNFVWSKTCQRTDDYPDVISKCAAKTATVNDASWLQGGGCASRNSSDAKHVEQTRQIIRIRYQRNAILSSMAFLPGNYRPPYARPLSVINGCSKCRAENPHIPDLLYACSYALHVEYMMNMICSRLYCLSARDHRVPLTLRTASIDLHTFNATRVVCEHT